MKVQYLWCWTLSSVSVCRQGYPSTPIPPLGPSPHRPLGMTVGVLPRKKNFPTHGPWDRDGSVPGHRKWSGCKKNPGKNGVQGAWRCTEGCTGGHGAQVGARLARVGVHVCAKVGMVEIGCGGYLGGTPPIGKLEPLGLISGEKVLQDGWQGWTDTSKCRNAAGFRVCKCSTIWPEMEVGACT